MAEEKLKDKQNRKLRSTATVVVLIRFNILFVGAWKRQPGHICTDLKWL
jgi:hypothetical protein